MTRTCLGLLLALALSSVATADVIHLRNGRTLRDVAVRQDVNGLRVMLSTGSLLLSPEEVLRVVTTPRAPAGPALASTALRTAAARIRAAYAAGHANVAADLLASHPDAYSALEAPSHAGVSGVFDGSTLRVTFRLRSADGPLALALPPGTLALVHGEDGDVPLALLRAPVVVLDAATPTVRVDVPVAWARFWSRAPAGEQRVRFRAASAKLERLAAVLCAGASAPPQAPAQLALWLAGDDVERAALVDLGVQLTCSRRLVLPIHERGAAALLRKAGVALRPLRFFEGRPLPPAPKADGTN